MNVPRRFTAHYLSALALLLLTPTLLSGQLISIKTIPIATEDQFLFFPSQNRGMGSVSIALNDLFLDPFINPAMGSRLEGSQLFATPSLYDASNDGGAGRAFPLTVEMSGRRWFGGALLSLQQIETAQTFFGPVFGADLLSESSANNIYAAGFLGTRLPETRAALGVGVFWAGLNAVQGVDVLYAGSQSIDQTGDLVDARLGLYGELGEAGRYEVVALYNYVDMTHEVTYQEWFAPEPIDTFTPIDPMLISRTETNLDRTRTWGLHLAYMQPLAAEGWQIGGILTGNWKSHPKIPNYEIMNIPRDPGNSFGVNAGLGISRSVDRATFGVDFILEPIWSDTWAEAEAPIRSVGGTLIPTGGATVENEFTFTNALIRAGFGYQAPTVGFQFGLKVRSIDYELKQTDNVQETKRTQTEGWIEWTPTWGFSVTLSGVELFYQGQVTTGVGRPGTAGGGVPVAEALSSDFIPAPNAPLTLQGATVGAHMFTVRVPIR